jgi:transposase
MSNKRARRKFTKEFKAEAVSLVTKQGYSISQAAESLGVGCNMLSRWKRQYEDEQSGNILSIDEREELKRLRRENKALRMEKEILKKASAFFAKEMS